MAADEQNPVPEGAAGQLTPIGAFIRLIPPTAIGADGLYANFVQVSTSPHDFSFIFGRYVMPPITTPQPPGTVLDVPIQLVALASLPLNLMKGTAKALDLAIQSWETTFGQELPEEPQPQTQPPTETGGGA